MTSPVLCCSHWRVTTPCPDLRNDLRVSRDDLHCGVHCSRSDGSCESHYCCCYCIRTRYRNTRDTGSGKPFSHLLSWHWQVTRFNLIKSFLRTFESPQHWGWYPLTGLSVGATELTSAHSDALLTTDCDSCVKIGTGCNVMSEIIREKSVIYSC